MCAVSRQHASPMSEISGNAMLSTRRTIDSFHVQHEDFTKSGGDAKQVKEFFNCISEPFFDISPTQVDELSIAPCMCILFI